MGAVGKVVDEKLRDEAAKKKRDEEKKKKDEEEAKRIKLEEEGFRVGSDLSLKASWREGFVAYTPNEDFWIHIGGWVQYDNVWWTQTDALVAQPDGRPGAKQGVASGAALGGIGDLQDGTSFRRVRLMIDGKFWENYEFTLIEAFENDQFQIVGLDEF